MLQRSYIHVLRTQIACRHQRSCSSTDIRSLYKITKCRC